MPLSQNAIVNLACQAVKAPGYTSQAQQLLNLILADLADTQDLDLCQNNVPIVLQPGATAPGFGSGPYNLPMDFKRMERDGFQFIYNQLPYKMVSFDLTEYLAQSQQTGLVGLPGFFATDISPLGQEPASNPLLYVWPPPQQVFNATAQYRRLLPDMTFTSAEVPWFPYQTYLIHKLTAKLAEIVDDSRMLAFHKLAEDDLRNFMQLTNDDEGRAKTVTLDGRRFGRGTTGLPDTKLVW